MALKKSELYRRIWTLCDNLRGGLDASQYKDYVLVLLFIKYIQRQIRPRPLRPITVPAGYVDSKVHTNGLENFWAY